MKGTLLINNVVHFAQHKFKYLGVANSSMEIKKAAHAAGRCALKAGYPILGALPSRAQDYLEKRFESYDKEKATDISSELELWGGVAGLYISVPLMAISPVVGFSLYLLNACLANEGIWRRCSLRFAPPEVKGSIVAKLAEQVYDAIYKNKKTPSTQFSEEDHYFTTRPLEKLEIGKERFEGTAGMQTNSSGPVVLPTGKQVTLYDELALNVNETSRTESLKLLFKKMRREGDPVSDERTKTMDELEMQSGSTIYVRGERTLRKPSSIFSKNIDAYKGIIEIDGVPEYEFVIDGNKKWTRHELHKFRGRKL